MIVVLDASTLINLANGEMLSKILGLSELTFHVSGMVRRESKTFASAIDAAAAAGHLQLIDDDLISANTFSCAKQELRLDDGETECILAAQVLGCMIACDDGAARQVIVRILGENRLTGSIGLLQRATRERLIDSQQAFQAYSRMRQRGGFLPAMSQSNFEVAG